MQKFVWLKSAKFKLLMPAKQENSVEDRKLGLGGKETAA